MSHLLRLTSSSNVRIRLELVVAHSCISLDLRFVCAPSLFLSLGYMQAWARRHFSAGLPEHDVVGLPALSPVRTTAHLLGVERNG